MAISITSSSSIKTSEVSMAIVLKQYLLLIILACVQFTFLMDYIIMMPLGPHILLDLKIDTQHFSYLLSGYTFSAAIFGFFSSFFIDKFERKKALVVCLIGFTIGPFLTAISTNFEMLILARIFTGAFGGVLSSMIMTVVGDAVPVEKLGRATSFVIAANAVASILGVPIAVFVADNWSWQMPFYAVICLNFVVLICIFFVVPSMRKHLEGAQMQNKRVLTVFLNPNFLWPIIFMSLLTLAGGYTILPYLSTFMVTNHGFRGDDLSFLFFLGGLASFVTGPIVGNVSDKLGKQNVFLWLNFLSIIPILLLTIYPLASKSVALSVTTLFFMFSTARHVSGMALVNSRFDQRSRGRFISLNGSIQLLAGSFGTILAGYLIYTEDGHLMNFDIIGLIAMSATILCIFTAFLIDE